VLSGSAKGDVPLVCVSPFTGRWETGLVEVVSFLLDRI
jgi:hypothetical protein